MSTVAKITKDRIMYGEFPSRVGLEWLEEQVVIYAGYSKIELRKETTPFRLKDDDEEVYYEGWLHDDPDGVVQSMLLSWGASDAGCAIIEIKKNGKWVQEIG